MGNWYVIQVRTGHEELVAKLCKSRIQADVLEDCFIPKFQKMKKIHGEWILSNEILFCGYVFVISNNIQALYQQLYEIHDLTKLLGKYGKDIFSLSEDEIVFLQSFSNDEKVVELSYGVIEGDQVIIREGPLKGKEALIKKINRHKRTALLELDMFDKTNLVKVGLEVVSKNEQP